MTDVRLQDVAARAGVSMATASYVLRNCPEARISPATRDRVRAVAEEIGYRLRAPHRVGGVVVLVAPEPTERVAPGFVAAVTETAWGAGLATVLLPGSGPAARDAAVAVQEAGLRTAGVIRVTGGDRDAQHEAEEGRSFAPVVVVDLTHESAAGATGEAVVVPDDRQAARQVAGALRGAGHHHLALVTTDPHARLAAVWAAGFADVLGSTVPVLQPGSAPHAGAPPPVRHLAGRPDRPTAVVCLDDPGRTSVEQLAQQLGSTPEDLAVVVRGGPGHDAAGRRGPLRVALPVVELARAALEALDRSRVPSGATAHGRHVTRVRFSEASFPTPPPARGALHVLLRPAGEQVPAR